jgi:tripartite-type tricarboxylate transporter receptor subunit TctC
LTIKIESQVTGIEGDKMKYLTNTRFVRYGALLACLFVTTFLASMVANATDAYPTKFIRLILPFPPGGGTDTLSRILGKKMGDAMGQSIVVDNRPGAAGNIATGLAARAPKDGYTLLMGFSTALVVNPSLYPDLNVNIERSFAPVSLIANAEYVLVVSPSLHIDTVKQLIDYAKAHPGKLNYSSSGVGSPLHLAGALFASRAGIQLVHVPANGGGPSILDVLNGQSQMAFGSVASTLPFIRAGKLKALAISGLKRSPVLPNLPTIDESGLPGFNVVTWYGLLAPAGTPQPVIDTLHDQLIKALADPEVKRSMENEGLMPETSTPQAFADRIRSDTGTWSKLVKQFDIKVE